MMKRTALLLLVFLIVAVGIFWAYQGTDTEPYLTEAQSPTLFADAANTEGIHTVGAGSSWPSDQEMAALRKEWSKLSSADSLLMEGLTANWIHPEGQDPAKLITAVEIPAGKDRSLADRLALGEKILRNPSWRTGVMRHYPALSGMAGPLEKRVLHLTSRGARTVAQMSRSLGLQATEIQPVVDAWVSVGWITMEEVECGNRYQAVNSAVAQGGALDFVTVQFRGEGPRHYTTLQAALKENAEEARSKWVTFSGVCPQTAKVVTVVLAAGRLRSEIPGRSFTATVNTVGRAAGFFAGEEAFNTWMANHEGVASEGRSSLDLFKDVLSSS